MTKSKVINIGHHTIVYVGEWEAMYNPGFNYTEFATIKK